MMTKEGSTKIVNFMTVFINNSNQMIASNFSIDTFLQDKLDLFTFLLVIKRLDLL